jgi:hypothetical protein
MRWSKLRKLVQESFADSVRGRVRIDVTNAHPRGASWRCSCNRGWISIDGNVVAHVDPHLGKLTLSLPRDQGVRGQQSYRSRFPEACWQYLHSGINDSLQSPDPFVSSLAMLNTKVGRTRLQRASTWDLHPLTRAMLEFRLQAEREARADDPDAMNDGGILPP